MLTAPGRPKPGDGPSEVLPYRHPMRDVAPGLDEGFTLVETIVALAILSISLTLVLRTLSGGFHYQQQAGALAEATLLAQSLMARVGSDLALRPGVEEGVLSNGLAWRVQIEPYGSASEKREWPVAAYAVAVDVSRGRSAATPLIVLNSLKLGPKDASR
jgi:general secretion pathway protein I